MLIFGKLASSILLPPGAIVILFILGFLFSLPRNSEKARKWSKAFIVVGALAFIACSLGPLADVALLPLENGHRAIAPVENLEKKDFEGCGAIVVLGAGALGSSPEEGKGSALGPRAARRVSYAYRLSRRLGLPIVFSGGKVFESTENEGEAQAAKRFLEESGMDAKGILIEDKSRSTWENAKFCAALLGESGIRAPRVVLVTSAFHMPRAVTSFRKNGIETIPAPTDYIVDRAPPGWIDWIPAPGGFEKIRLAFHEYFGGLWYSLRPSVKP